MYAIIQIIGYLLTFDFIKKQIDEDKKTDYLFQLVFQYTNIANIDVK